MDKAVTESEWSQVLEQESAELFALSIVDELLQRSHDVLFEKHIESQVLPYAVQFCKNTIERMVEWQFFKRDPGDVDAVAWVADEEPKSALVDSWARGAVPMRKPPPPKPQSKLLAGAGTVSTASLPSAAEQARSVEAVESSDSGSLRDELGLSIPLKKTSLKPPASYSVSSHSTLGRSKSGASSVGSVSLKSKASMSSFISHSRVLKVQSTGPGLRPRSSKRGAISGSAEAAVAMAAADALIMEENKKALARIANIEKDGGKANYTYDQEGRILFIKKLPQGKHVTNGVRTKILSSEEPSPAKVKPESRAPVPFNRRRVSSIAQTGTSANSNTSVGSTFKSSQSSLNAPPTTVTPGINHAPHYVEDKTLDIPSMAETMRLAPGVVLREGDVVKKGPPLSKKLTKEPTMIEQSTVQQQGGGKRSTRSSAVATVLPHSEGSDAVLDQVLNNARPILKPISLPVHQLAAVRSKGRVQVGGGTGGSIVDVGEEVLNMGEDMRARQPKPLPSISSQ